MIGIQFRDGTVRRYECHLSPWESASLRREDGSIPKAKTEFSIFERLLTLQEIDDRQVLSFGIELANQPPPAPGAASGLRPSEHSKVSRCRSVFAIAKVLLPQGVRDDAMDEWMDEIECAADENLPVLRRAISILFRSLPILAWRSRLPSRVRRPGSQ